jgi:hypothetical protein
VCCALAAPDVRAGLLAAVNHGGDSDSTGSIAGNLLGAHHGRAPPAAEPGGASIRPRGGVRREPCSQPQSQAEQPQLSVPGMAALAGTGRRMVLDAELLAGAGTASDFYSALPLVTKAQRSRVEAGGPDVAPPAGDPGAEPGSLPGAADVAPGWMVGEWPPAGTGGGGRQMVRVPFGCSAGWSRRGEMEAGDARCADVGRCADAGRGGLGGGAGGAGGRGRLERCL